MTSASLTITPGMSQCKYSLPPSLPPPSSLLPPPSSLLPPSSSDQGGCLVDDQHEMSMSREREGGREGGRKEG